MPTASIPGGTVGLRKDESIFMASKDRKLCSRVRIGRRNYSAGFRASRVVKGVRRAFSFVLAC